MRPNVMVITKAAVENLELILQAAQNNGSHVVLDPELLTAGADWAEYSRIFDRQKLLLQVAAPWRCAAAVRRLQSEGGSSCQQAAIHCTAPVGSSRLLSASHHGSLPSPLFPLLDVLAMHLAPQMPERVFAVGSPAPQACTLIGGLRFDRGCDVSVHYHEKGTTDRASLALHGGLPQVWITTISRSSNLRMFWKAFCHQLYSRSGVDCRPESFVRTLHLCHALHEAQTSGRTLWLDTNAAAAFPLAETTSTSGWTGSDA